MRYRFVHELGVLRSGTASDEAAVWEQFVDGGYAEQAHVVAVHVRTDGPWREIRWQGGLGQAV